MSTNTEKIMIQEIEGKLDKTKSIEENFKIAAVAAKEHWLAPNEKEAFNTAVIAVSSIYGLESEEFARIKQEMKMVNAFHFTPTNVPVDMGALMEDLDPKYKPIGFVKIWKELYQK